MNEPAAAHEDRLGDRLMRLIWWRSPNPDLAERTRRRITVHLIPYLFFLYILAYLDRVNVSVAGLRMTKSPEEGGLGFTDEIVGFGFGLFFWGYWVLEIPSTISVVKWGARWVFVRILVLWGLCAATAGLIGHPLLNNAFAWIPILPSDWPVLGAAFQWINELRDNPKHQFYFLRVLLGFFEGGFFPSVIVYLSLWFRQQDRAKAIACFMIAIPLSSAVGLPISGLLLDVNWFGLDGWRWVFIIEGIIPVLAGFVTIFFLPNRPKDANWLPADEREWLEGELHRDHEQAKSHSHWGWTRHLGMVLLLTIVYFGLNVSSYGLSSFMPKIIKSQMHFGDKASAIIAALPFFMGFLAMLFNAWHSDKTKERPWHVATPLFFLSMGLLAAALLDGRGWLSALVMIFWVGTCMYAHLPAFWPIPTMFLGATAAASAIGFINMVGNLGGSLGPTLVGKAATTDANFAGGLLKLAPWPLMAATTILIVSYVRRRMPAKN